VKRRECVIYKTKNPGFIIPKNRERGVTGDCIANIRKFFEKDTIKEIKING